MNIYNVNNADSQKITRSSEMAGYVRKCNTTYFGAIRRWKNNLMLHMVISRKTMSSWPTFV